MIYGHYCRKCGAPFECPVVTHCSLRSDNPDKSKRPLCQECYEEVTSNADLLKDTGDGSYA